MIYYRHKILLSLIEKSKSSLDRNVLEKLLFLFCQQTGNTFYDFFPSDKGATSFLSRYDQGKLIEKGFLKNSPFFSLKEGVSLFGQLKSRDQTLLDDFFSKLQTFHPATLLKYICRDYPQYAIKTDNVERLLAPEEKSNVENAKQNIVSDKIKLFTIGYEGKSIDKYIQQLLFNDVKLIVDVRRNPLSRKHGFSKTKFSNYLRSVDVQYVHIPELGIASQKRKNLQNTSDYEQLFEQYASETLPTREKQIAEVLSLLQSHKRIALTCFEKEACMCHRHKIVDKLQKEIECFGQITHI